MVGTIQASWDAQQWYAFGTNALAASALIAGLWAVYNYRKAKRAEAARWLQGLFKEFYTDPALITARELIEYDYRQTAEPLLQLRVTDRTVSLSKSERTTLRHLDLVLNYFEQVVYLEEEGHLERRDVDVFFQYWFDQLRLPDRATLRRYLATCGYEKCAAMVAAPPLEYVAFYGTLMHDFPGQDQLRIRDRLRYVGPCRIPGRIYNMGDWPSLVLSAHEVHGELYECDDRTIFRIIDPFERYDPTDRAGSGYVRRCVRLIEPAVDAWTYVSNEPVSEDQLIPSGSWSEFVQGIKQGGASTP